MTNYNILNGSSNVFNSIWCDTTTSINNGIIYISNAGSITFIDVGSNIIKDYFSTENKGSTNEVIEDSSIVDINIVV